MLGHGTHLNLHAEDRRQRQMVIRDSRLLREARRTADLPKPAWHRYDDSLPHPASSASLLQIMEQAFPAHHRTHPPTGAESALPSDDDFGRD